MSTDLLTRELSARLSTSTPAKPAESVTAIQRQVTCHNALIGSVLRIKPILILDDGEIATKLKIRTYRKGIQSLQTLAEACGDLENAAVVYTTDATEASDLANRISNNFVTTSKPLVVRLSPAVGTHGGPGVIGVVCVKAKP